MAKNSASAKRKSEPAKADRPDGDRLSISVSDNVRVSDCAYTVVARRYRPQRFEDVVGQEAIAKALSGAIRAGRVAHAYLFTGARGVGKTSTARIFAKALNCERGPTPQPCGVCDACRAIATGDDIDVLEIDGASNRGIDEIRDLRANVHFRPTRSRYKIYIIDEVHMLTREAFNALLKTLEEPPEHVKFLFCTTEPHKVPDTILSRCQRFDFGLIRPESIRERLAAIVREEGARADDEALDLIARRGAGSLRDAQSLLEQVLAYGDQRVSAETVHRLLGTASDDRVVALADAVVRHDRASAFRLLDEVAEEGVQLAELVEQLLDYFRDTMVSQSGGGKVRLVSVADQWRDRVSEHAGAMPLENILAAMQILAETRTRMRGSTYGRTLVELALVRCCLLEEMESITALLRGLDSGGPPNGATGPARTPAASLSPPAGRPASHERTAAPARRAKKNDEAAAPAESVVPSVPGDLAASELTCGQAAALWPQVVASLDDMLAAHAQRASGVATSGPNRVVVRFDPAYNFHKSVCEQPDNQAAIEQAWTRRAGRPVRVVFDTAAGQLSPTEGAESVPSRATYRKRLTESARVPLVKRAMDLFGATILRVE